MKIDRFALEITKIAAPRLEQSISAEHYLRRFNNLIKRGAGADKRGR
jgi:hypothetical protein